jgi:hypothetical protein
LNTPIWKNRTQNVPSTRHAKKVSDFGASQIFRLGNTQPVKAMQIFQSSPTSPQSKNNNNNNNKTAN